MLILQDLRSKPLFAEVPLPRRKCPDNYRFYYKPKKVVFCLKFMKCVQIESATIAVSRVPYAYSKRVNADLKHETFSKGYQKRYFFRGDHRERLGNLYLFSKQRPIHFLLPWLAVSSGGARLHACLHTLHHLTIL